MSVLGAHPARVIRKSRVSRPLVSSSTVQRSGQANARRGRPEDLDTAGAGARVAIFETSSANYSSMQVAV
jgi:hypothetical protein